MAAKDFWTREQADHLASQITQAFSSVPNGYEVGTFIERIIVCGDVRRNPTATNVKHLCVVGVCKPSVNLADVRGFVKANVSAIYPGSSVRNFKLYDYVELPDGSGNVSWLVVPQEQAGAATLHATGPVSFIKMMEMFAESQGMIFGASGLKRGDDKLVSVDENEVFSVIGAHFVPLNERETVRYLEPTARS